MFGIIPLSDGSWHTVDDNDNDDDDDTVLRALAGNLEYVKPVVAEGDQNEEEEFTEVLEPGLTFLDGANIIHHPHGAKHALDDLRALDLVGIYFSAHWCPPCRKFTCVYLSNKTSRAFAPD